MPYLTKRQKINLSQISIDSGLYSSVSTLADTDIFIVHDSSSFDNAPVSGSTVKRYVESERLSNAIYLYDDGIYLDSPADGRARLVSDGTGAKAIELSSSGGFNLHAQHGTIGITGSLVHITSSTNIAKNIMLHASGGVADTLLLTSSFGTSADAIGLRAGQGGITLDAGLDIVLDADGADISFKDGGTQYLKFTSANSAADVDIVNGAADGDIIFKDAGGNEVFRMDGGEEALLVASGKKLMLGAAEESLHGDGTDIHFSVGSGGDINIPADIGLTFGHATDDKIEGDASGMTITSQALTLDSAADIVLDAGGADVILKDDATEFGRFTKATNDLVIKSAIGDGDVLIKGVDDSSEITAATFDMSNAGKLTLNDDLVVSGGDIDVDSAKAMNVGASVGANNLTLGGGSSTVVVAGNLTVNGTTTTVNSTTVTVDDPIFTLGGDTAPGSDDNKDRGIEFRYHDGSSARVGFFGWDDDTGRFTVLKEATNSSEVFSGTGVSIQGASFYTGTTEMVTTDGAAKVQSQVAGDGLAHAAGVLSVNLDDHGALQTSGDEVSFRGIQEQIFMSASATGTTQMTHGHYALNADTVRLHHALLDTSAGTVHSSSKPEVYLNGMLLRSGSAGFAGESAWPLDNGDDYIFIKHSCSSGIGQRVILSSSLDADDVLTVRWVRGGTAAS